MPSKRSPTTVKYLDRVLMLYICCAVSVLKQTKHFGSSVSARQNGKTYGRAAQNPFGNPVYLSNNPKVKTFTPWGFQACRFLTDMGQSLKGWVPAPDKWKHKDASPKKSCETKGSLFKKRKQECIERERGKQERRLKKEKRRKKRKRVSAAREQILATCKI